MKTDSGDRISCITKSYTSINNNLLVSYNLSSDSNYQENCSSFYRVGRFRKFCFHTTDSREDLSTIWKKSFEFQRLKKF